MANIRGKTPNNAWLAGDIKFLVSQSCYLLFTGNKPPHDATGYIPAFKGGHAIIGHVAPGFTFLDPHAHQIPYKFISYWTDKDLNFGIYTAWREAQFEWCYDLNNLPIAPGVVFTIGSLHGQHTDRWIHYWGWEERYYNLYNGAAFLTEQDKNNHPAVGEVITYDPDFGWPDKIGHKWAEKGNPDWSHVVPWI